MKNVALVDENDIVQNITEIPDDMVIVEAGKYFLPPGGMRGIELAGDEGAVIGGSYADGSFSPPPATVDNVNAFLLEAMGTFGLERGNSIIKAWPAFTIALGAGNWSVARQVLDAMHQHDTITQEEHDTAAALMSAHNIP